MITTPKEELRHKKAIAYVRVSSSRQIDNESPATQKEKIQAYADANGIEIIEWFYDEAKSAKNADREELNHLLKYALGYNGKIDHVIVYKMSRASRDITSYYMQIKGVLMGRGITLRSATEAFDDSSTGRFMELIYVGLAQMDNDSKREYTLDNMKSLAKQGWYQHPPVVGYSVHRMPNYEGKLRPSLKANDMAPIVRDILERFSIGDISKAELTRYAQDLGLKMRGGGAPGEDSINRMLKQPTYAGYVCDRFTEYVNYEGKHKPIISKEIFERNQSILYAKNSRKDEIHLKKNETYVLKGTLLCSGCNKRLYASAPKTGNGGHSPRYHCGKCKIPSIPARFVHHDFEDMLKRIKPTEGTLRLDKEILVRESNSQLGRINSAVHHFRSDLDEISTLRVQAIEKFTAGDLTKDEKTDLVDNLEKRKLDISFKLREAELQQGSRESDIEYAINFMDQVDKQWTDADFDLQQRFQKMIFPHGVVYDSQNRRFGTYEISVLYRSVSIEKVSEETLKSYLVAGPGLEPGTSWL